MSDAENDDRISVLIVDDHSIVRMGVRRIIDGPCEVLGEAADGKEALEAAQKLQPDVVLMDLRMPVMDGITATQEIKKSMPATKVLVFTSNDHDIDVLAAFNAGADGYCSKDCSPAHIFKAIDVVHSGGIYLDAGIARLVLRSYRPFADKQGETEGKKPLLSRRELDVLKLIVDGLTNPEIAERLGLSSETVKTHVRHVMEKLAVADRTQAAVKAIREKIV